MQNCMTVSNVGLANVLSDPFGKTATDIMAYLLSNTSDTIDEKTVRKLIRKGAIAKSDEIIEAIKGYNIEADQALKLELAQRHLAYLENKIAQTEVELYVRIKPYYQFVQNISSISGISELSATIILAEIGVDMNVSESSERLCSWCGLVPENKESAGKKKSIRVAKFGTYLKPLMVQYALAAVKSKKQPYFSIKYQNIKKRRGHKKAIIAIARMMMTSIFHLISKNETFNPTDYKELSNPKPRKQQVVLNDATTLAYL